MSLTYVLTECPSGGLLCGCLYPFSQHKMCTRPTSSSVRQLLLHTCFLLSMSTSGIYPSHITQTSCGHTQKKQYECTHTQTHTHYNTQFVFLVNYWTHWIVTQLLTTIKLDILVTKVIYFTNLFLWICRCVCVWIERDRHRQRVIRLIEWVSFSVSYRDLFVIVRGATCNVLWMMTW